MMEEYRNDLGEDYIPFINMIDINYIDNHHDHDLSINSTQHYPLRMAAQQQTLWRTFFSRSSNGNNYNTDHHPILEEMKEKEERTRTSNSLLLAVHHVKGRIRHR